MTTAAKKTYVTPRGVAVWPSLRTPDSRPINGKPVTPAYKTRLRLEGEAIAQFTSLIDPLVEAALAEAMDKAPPPKRKLVKARYPYAPEYDKEGNETGAYLVSFKRTAEGKRKDGTPWKAGPIPVFDAKRQVIPAKVNVGNGSVIKVGFEVVPYYIPLSNEAGVSLRLSSVQVLDLVEFTGMKSAAAYGFEDEEGFDASSIKDDEPGAEFANSDEDTGGTDEDF